MFIPMSLFEKINEDIKAAMKAREQLKLETLRAIKKDLLEAKTAKDAGGLVSEEDEIKILQKMAKQRRDSAAIYHSQGRPDLGAKEEQEVEFITPYLPAQLSQKELETAVNQIIQQLGASSIKEMGKVIGAASTALAGKADGKEISLMARKLLS
jgi:uncharacterized protein